VAGVILNAFGVVSTVGIGVLLLLFHPPPPPQFTCARASPETIPITLRACGIAFVIFLPVDSETTFVFFIKEQVIDN
jgi:hypothetical protein